MANHSTPETFGSDMATTLDEVLAFSIWLQANSEPGPAPGSRAEIEIQNKEHGPGGNWGEKPIRSAYAVAGTSLMIANSNYITSLAQLLRQEPVALFGFQVMTRALVEASARSWWILDPTIYVRERVLRGTIERWNSLIELKGVDEAGGRPQSEHQQRADKFVDDSIALGIDPTRNKRNEVTGFGRRPASTEVVHDFLTAIGLKHGRLWYKLYSGIVHSALYGVMQYVDFQAVDGTNLLKPVPVLPLQALADATVLAISSFLASIECHAILYGRQTELVRKKRFESVGRVYSIAATLQEE